MSKYNNYYKYNFKINSNLSYLCTSSKIYKKNIILGTCCGFYIPIPFWFCRNTGGNIFHCKRQPLIQVKLEFPNIKNMVIK